MTPLEQKQRNEIGRLTKLLADVQASDRAKANDPRTTQGEGSMSGFGHRATTGQIGGLGFHMDAWGNGPFYIRIKGKRYAFEDSDMFGPSLLNKNGSISEKQPISERHPFWLGYCMWRRGGRRVRWGGKVCIYEKPKPGTYWRDEQNISHFLTDPPEDLDYLGYVRVDQPTAERGAGGAP
jgi:hypothetical protein